MFEYLIIARKIEPCPPLWNLGRKSGQKNGLNLTMTWVKTFFFFFGLHLNLDRRTGWIWVKTFVFYFYLCDLHVSYLVFIYLFKFLSTRLVPPFENLAYATRTGVGNLYPLSCIRRVISNIHPRSLMWLPEVVGHATKSCSETTPTIVENFFFLGSSTTNRPKTTLKFGEYLFFIFILFQMIPKRAKL